MIYTTLLAIGIIGLVMLAFLGGGHAHSGHSGHGLGHAGQGGGHGHAGHGAGQGHHGHAAQQGDQQAQGSRDLRSTGASVFWSLLSPLSLFSLCLGAGVTGLAAGSQHWPSLYVGLAAGAGAALFYGAVVRPLWALVFRFASTPSGALEATVSQSAEALTGFDKSGAGIVRVNVDGQLVRVLAVLESDERNAGAVIKPGDPLMVTSVDEKTNRCHVTRL